MNSEQKSGISAIILALLIVAANVLTIVHVVNYYRPHESLVKVTSRLFPLPDHIIVTCGQESAEFAPADDEYTTLFMENTRRETGFDHYDTIYDSVLNRIDKEICLEYRYDNKKRITVETPLERRNLSTDSVRFVLTGENNGFALFSVDEEVLEYAGFSVNAELIEAARECLK